MNPVNFDELLKQLGSSNQAKAFVALRKLTEAALKARGEDRKQFAAKLAEALNARTPTKEEETKPDRKGRVRKKVTGGEPIHGVKVRRELARLLATCGSEAQVDALKDCLGDLDLRDMARWTLDRIQAPSATDALIATIQDAIGPEFRTGIANALGYKSGGNAVQALKGLLADADQDVRGAAGDALAKHPDLSADAALMAAIKASSGHGQGRVKQRLIKARVRHAETLARAGHKEAARAVYQSLAAEAPDEAVKRAAQIGLNASNNSVAASPN